MSSFEQRGTWVRLCSVHSPVLASRLSSIYETSFIHGTLAAMLSLSLTLSPSLSLSLFLSLSLSLSLSLAMLARSLLIYPEHMCLPADAAHPSAGVSCSGAAVPCDLLPAVLAHRDPRRHRCACRLMQRNQTIVARRSIKFRLSGGVDRATYGHQSAQHGLPSASFCLYCTPGQQDAEEL